MLRQSRQSQAAVVDRSPRADVSVEADIAGLADLDLDDLRQRWRGLFGRAAPKGFSRFLLLRTIAYRLQADRFGDLDAPIAGVLEKVGRVLQNSKPGVAELPSIVPPVPATAARSGTMLVREWNGITHRVMILDRGFAWNGKTYDSLSSIARLITGTSWNGPRFFGLRDRGTKHPRPAE